MKHPLRPSFAARIAGTRWVAKPTILLSLVLCVGLPATPPPATTASVAELPRDTVPMLDHVTWPCTKRVTSPGALRSALKAAKHNDVLCIPPGTTWTESQPLPNREDDSTSIVTVRVDLPDSLFALPGERITPTKAAAAKLPVLRAPDRVFYTAPGAHGYHFIGLDLQTTGMVAGSSTTIMEIGQPSARTLSALPYNIYIDRVLARPSAPSGSIRRAFSVNAGATAITGSDCSDIHEQGSDSQCVWGSNGTGPYRITNNFLSALSEVIIFGGADPAIKNLVVADITIARNHIHADPAWKGVWKPFKSRIETKAQRRTLIEANVIENAWVDAPHGEAILVKTNNQNGQCNLCVTADVTIRRNYIKKTVRGFYVVGQDGTNFKADSSSRRISITENWVDSLNTGVARQPGGSNAPFDVSFIGNVRDVEFSRNVFNASGPGINHYLGMYQDRGLGPIAVNNLKLDRNIFDASRYGVLGCAAPFRECSSNVTFGATALVGPLNNVTVIPNARGYASVAAALRSGLGVQWATIQSAIAGVVIPR